MRDGNHITEHYIGNSGIDYKIVYLSDEVKDTIVYKTTYNAFNTGDSLYKENTTHYNDENYELVNTKTLNQVMIDRKLPQPDFLKLDVQGAELDVLAGASDVINGCKLILAECPISPYNIGSPEINDYLNYFKKIGFTPLRITEQHNDAGALLQVDILFLRNIFLSKFN